MFCIFIFFKNRDNFTNISVKNTILGLINKLYHLIANPKNDIIHFFLPFPGYFWVNHLLQMLINLLYSSLRAVHWCKLLDIFYIYSFFICFFYIRFYFTYTF